MTDKDYIEAARILHPTVEVDDDAVVSRGDDDGAHVQAWVWVPAEYAIGGLTNR